MVGMKCCNRLLLLALAILAVAVSSKAQADDDDQSMSGILKVLFESNPKTLLKPKDTLELLEAASRSSPKSDDHYSKEKLPLISRVLEFCDVKTEKCKENQFLEAYEYLLGVLMPSFEMVGKHGGQSAISNVFACLHDCKERQVTKCDEQLGTIVFEKVERTTNEDEQSVLYTLGQSYLAKQASSDKTKLRVAVLATVDLLIGLPTKCSTYKSPEIKKEFSTAFNNLLNVYCSPIVGTLAAEYEEYKSNIGRYDTINLYAKKILAAVQVCKELAENPTIHSDAAYNEGLRRFTFGYCRGFGV